MDIFGFLVPSPKFVNGLPSLSFLDYTLDGLIYIIALVPIILWIFKFNKNKIAQVFIAGWFLVSFLYLIQSTAQAYAEYNLLGNKSIEELRNITTANNFYAFIQEAKKQLEPDEEIKIITPEAGDYFERKAPYFLYPHPLTSNAKVILIFNLNLEKTKNKQNEIKLKRNKDNEIILGNIESIDPLNGGYLVRIKK